MQEYCDGGTLRSHMKKIKPMSEPEAIEILTQICRGFTELLKNGIIHRLHISNLGMSNLKIF